MLFKRLQLGVMRDDEPAPAGGQAPAEATPPPVQAPPQAEKQAVPPQQARREMLRSARPEANGAPAPPTEAPRAAPQQQPETSGQEAQAAEPEEVPRETSPLDDIDPDSVNFDDEEEKVEAKPEPTPEQSAEQNAEQARADDRASGDILQEVLGLSDEQRAEFEKDPKKLHRLEAAILKSSRGKRMRGALSVVQDLSKPSSEGGIGYEPTPEELKDGFIKGRGFQRFVQDLENLHEDPSHAPDVLGFLFGNKDQPSQSAAALAQQIPAYLVQQNPQAFHHLRGVMTNGLAYEVESRAKQERDPQMKRFYEQLAYGVRYYLDPSAAQQQAPNGQAQPQLEESPELKRLREENEQYRQRATQAQQAQYENAVNSFQQQAAKAVEGMVRKVFSGVELNDRLASPHFRDKANEVMSRIYQDPMLREEVDALINRAVRRNDQYAMNEALARIKRAAATPVRVLSADLKEVLKPIAKSRKSEAEQAQQLHDKFQQNGQQYRQPGSTGAPAPGSQSALPRFDPSSGMSINEWRSQALKSVRPN